MCGPRCIRGICIRGTDHWIESLQRGTLVLGFEATRFMFPRHCWKRVASWLRFLLLSLWHPRMYIEKSCLVELVVSQKLICSFWKVAPEKGGDNKDKEGVDDWNEEGLRSNQRLTYTLGAKSIDWCLDATCLLFSIMGPLFLYLTRWIRRTVRINTLLQWNMPLS